MDEDFKDNLLERIQAGRPKRRPRPLRTALIAACVCLALVGTVFAAGTISGISISDFFCNGTAYDAEGGKVSYSGYTVQIDSFLPLESLSDEARALAKGENNTQEFASWAEAEEFLGLKLAQNPVLEGASHLRYAIGGTWYPCRLSAYCREEGEEVAALDVSAWYRLWEKDHSSYVPILVTAYVFTDQAAEGTMDWAGIHTEDGAVRWDGYYPEGAQFTREDYVNPYGLETVIIGVDAEWDPAEIAPVYDYIFEANFVLNNVYYRVQVAYPDPDSAYEAHATAPYTDVEAYTPHALAVLKEVLDGFE